MGERTQYLNFSLEPINGLVPVKLLNDYLRQLDSIIGPTFRDLNVLYAQGYVTSATAFYVSTTGNDGDDGTSTGSALATIAEALRRVGKIIAKDAYIILGTGTWTFESLDLSDYIFLNGAKLYFMGTLTEIASDIASTAVASNSISFAEGTLLGLTVAGGLFEYNTAPGVYYPILSKTIVPANPDVMNMPTYAAGGNWPATGVTGGNIYSILTLIDATTTRSTITTTSSQLREDSFVFQFLQFIDDATFTATYGNTIVRNCYFNGAFTHYLTNVSLLRNNFTTNSNPIITTFDTNYLANSLYPTTYSVEVIEIPDNVETGTINYYVTTAGNDATGDGKSTATAFLTVARALQEVKYFTEYSRTLSTLFGLTKMVATPNYVINVGPGTINFSDAATGTVDIIVEGINSVKIQGTMSAFVPTTPTALQSIPAARVTGSTRTTVVLNSTIDPVVFPAVWADHELRGVFAKFAGDANYYPIYDNIEAPANTHTLTLPYRAAGNYANGVIVTLHRAGTLLQNAAGAITVKADTTGVDLKHTFQDVTFVSNLTLEGFNLVECTLRRGTHPLISALRCDIRRDAGNPVVNGPWFDQSIVYGVGGAISFDAIRADNMIFDTVVIEPMARPDLFEGGSRVLNNNVYNIVNFLNFPTNALSLARMGYEQLVIDTAAITGAGIMTFTGGRVFMDTVALPVLYSHIDINQQCTLHLVAVTSPAALADQYAVVIRSGSMVFASAAAGNTLVGTVNCWIINASASLGNWGAAITAAEGCLCHITA